MEIDSKDKQSHIFTEPQHYVPQGKIIYSLEHKYLRSIIRKIMPISSPRRENAIGQFRATGFVMFTLNFILQWIVKLVNEQSLGGVNELLSYFSCPRLLTQLHMGNSLHLWSC